MESLNNYPAVLVVVLILLVAVATFDYESSAQEDNPSIIVTPIDYEAADQVVTLLNKTSEGVDLSGFRISDGRGNVFEFSESQPALVKIGPFEVLRIHSSPGAKKDYDGESDFYWTDKAIWNREKTVQLVNPSGEVVYKLALSATSDIDQLASCLTRNEVVLYGMEACSHCQTQKEKFGSAMEYINYIEYSENRKRCCKQGITVVPTWVFGRDEQRLIGTRSLKELSKLAGCSYHE